MDITWRDDKYLLSNLLQSGVTVSEFYIFTFIHKHTHTNNCEVHAVRLILQIKKLRSEKFK